MGLTNSRTSINAQPAPGVANLAQVPLAPQMFISAKDSTASGFLTDSIWTDQANTAANISAFPGLSQAGTDAFYMQFASSAGGLSQASGWVYSSNGTKANGTRGQKFGVLKLFDFRGVPKPASIAPVGTCDPVYFVGMAKDV